MSIKALSEYTIYAKYAQFDVTKKRRETWSEMIDRVFNMHEEKYKDYLNDEKFKEYFSFAKEMVKKKKVLGSQRALQYGGKSILKHEAKIYNCCFTHISRVESFQETMYLLLCGVGVGFSVQKSHVDKLPNIYPLSDIEKEFIIPDSIEGWADAIGVLMNSYFRQGKFNEFHNGERVVFDYSQIRPEGSLIAGQFKAPGHKGLKMSLEKIKNVIDNRLKNRESRLHPIDVYDIIMHASDAVLSGGLRRAATISLFSPDDDEMMNAKTGSWFIENPQRGRSNNSVALIRSKADREVFSKIMKSTREMGEPGFVFLEHEDVGVNPCVEISMYPITEDGVSGNQFCNLCEINGKHCVDEASFYQACKAAAILGTLQAGYTNFAYVSDATKKITDREALLGVSITGIMDNPEVLLKEDVLKKGAEIVKETNEIFAKIININPAARTTCVKPAGSTSCVLSSASGIHPHHARRYIRRVQANKMEFPVQYFKKVNPLAVEESVWSAGKTDEVISFLCEVPKGSIVKNQMGAIALLDSVKTVQSAWVKTGTNESYCVLKGIEHNVSNTITVKDDEWNEVEDYIFNNKKFFTGISLLPFSGDKDYAQAPFTTIYTPEELVEMYGDASVFASGLIVDGLKAFDNNLWRACDTALGFGETLVQNMEIPEYPKLRNYKELSEYFIRKEAYEEWFLKTDWVRRVKQFADRYFSGNTKNATYCLKDVSNWKLWVDLKREYKEINWSDVVEEHQTHIDVDMIAGAACAGGVCEIKF